jgi:transposase
MQRWNSGTPGMRAQLQVESNRSSHSPKCWQGKIDGILSHCGYPLHTGLLEGINNKIKVIKRMAYGFRDDEYFFLKIRAVFPGIAG